MESSKKATVIVFSGDMDKVFAAFTLATTAAAGGMDTTMFFTFWGLEAIQKGNRTGKGLMGRMLDLMNRGGLGRLGPSKFNFGGMGRWMFKKMMAPKGVAPLEELARRETMQERYPEAKTEGSNGDEAFSKGIRALGMLGERARKHRNVSGEDNAARLAWTANLPSPPQGIDRKAGATTVYFVGCVSAMFPTSYAIPQSFAGILRKAGVDFTTLGTAGLKSLGAERLVMACPSCYYMWKHRYPEELGASLGLEILTASQLLRDLAAEGHLRFAEPKRQETVTYHDPCDLGRKGGHHEKPREVISRVPGMTLVEMQSSREHAPCCGGGGDLETFQPELTQQVAAKRVALARAILGSASVAPDRIRIVQVGIGHAQTFAGTVRDMTERIRELGRAQPRVGEPRAGQ